MDDLKEVEERARLAILQGKEDTGQMVVRLAKGIWLGIEEQESELKKAKIREMSLKLNDLESGLARERETSKALLSAQAELQVELDTSRICGDYALMCNREFAE
ncbi:hypothetical protein GIB67_027002 [Kingdonia uniflora]|uniref:Uncharacterized protein n=1 Tax=Kingdonia uniflora TaxID=39325 RepID=A0A7J7P1F9_9MAGN|nr:hypothetical protein GIB67_027002 [Kingdonia uniflora]